jgi:hypothetical protein
VASVRQTLLRSRVTTAYRAVALHLLNTLVIFVLLNLVLVPVFYLKDKLTPSPGPGPLSAYSKADLAHVYPHMKEDQWTALLVETWAKPFVFESFTHFKETPSRGKYVNVAADGFRTNERRRPWPPEPDAFNVFFFGGSTTFGYGIGDEETIPSAFEDILMRQACVDRLHVYNFGRGYYYSSQEQILFLRLLARGFVPQLAIFVDGVNENRLGLDDPQWADEFRDHLANRAKRGGVSVDIVTELPIFRALRSLQSRLGLDRENAGVSPVPPGDVKKTAPLDVRRYLRNKGLTETLAAHFNMKTLFVWQPSPAYGYNLDYHLFPPFKWQVERGTEFYDEFNEQRARLSERERANMLWLGDLQRHRMEPLYVDQFHYTAAFAREIAEQIAQAVVARNLVCGGASSNAETR